MSILVLLLAFTGSPAQAGDNQPVIVELFTSQSCSSCPPADKVLKDIADKPGVIALGCHVTYWDHLSWKDTLSLPACTERQRDYSRAFAKRGPYTPQAVINGIDEMVGSRKRAVLSSLKKRQSQPPATINTSMIGHDLTMSLPAIDIGGQTLSLWLFAYDDAHTQSIPSGENRGRTVDYINPVRHIVSLGSWDGTARTVQHNIGAMSASGGYAVLAQPAELGPVYAAGSVKAP